MAPKKAIKVRETDDADIARKIWLAGVGAYGRVFTETQGAVEKLAGSANETFEQLVASGAEIEDAVRTRIAKSGAAERVTSLVETVSKRVKDIPLPTPARLDARIGQVRKTVADTLAPFRVVTLTRTIDRLNAKVDALSTEVAKLKSAAPKAKRKGQG